MYELTATKFLGSATSGVGMPSISKWAKKQKVCLEHGTKKTTKKLASLGGEKERVALQRQVGTAIDKTDGDEELEEVAMDVLKKSRLKQTAIDLLWQQTVVDITSTVHEAAQIVLYDQNATPEVRKARAEGMEVLGQIFANAEKPAGLPANTAQLELETVAFHAVLDTIWRQEMNARNSSNPEVED